MDNDDDYDVLMEITSKVMLMAMMLINKKKKKVSVTEVKLKQP